MNKVILMGRLARDPECRTTQSGQMKANFTLAVDRMSKEKMADFIGLTAWGKTAEFVSQYLCKGRQVLVEGRIQTGSYEKDGKKVYTTDVMVDRIEFADKKPQGNAEEPPF